MELLASTICALEGADGLDAWGYVLLCGDKTVPARQAAVHNTTGSPEDLRVVLDSQTAALCGGSDAVCDRVWWT